VVRKTLPRMEAMPLQDPTGARLAAGDVRLVSAAGASSLGELFGTGPFARMDNFENCLQRELSSVRGLPEF
jgi:hypothetical protein